MAILNARLIMIQVYCKLSLIPACIKREDDNKPQPRSGQQPKKPGIEHLKKVQAVGMSGFDSRVKAKGYTLVDASVRPIGNQALAKFVLAEVSHSVTCPQFQEQKPLVEQALATLLKEGLWDVIVWNNHYFKDGEPVGDERMLVIKLDNRDALVDCHGKKIVRWKTDTSGRRIGNNPAPVEPDVCLKANENGIVVVSASA